jgi:hypothetical protein
MARDLYGKNTQFGDTSILTADIMKMSVAGGGNIEQGFLVQNVTIQYNQPLNRIYEIGTNLVYFAPGRSIGTMQMGRIVGKEPITGIFGATGSGIWTTKGIGQAARVILLSSIGTTGGSADAPAVTFKVNGAVIESYGFATDANGLLVQENVTIQFAGLELL